MFAVKHRKHFDRPNARMALFRASAPVRSALQSSGQDESDVAALRRAAEAVVRK